MIDALLVAVFVGWALRVGWRSRREAGRDLESYFLAGRSLTAWESGLSMTASTRRIRRTVGAARADQLLAFDPWQAPKIGGALLAVLGVQWLAQVNSDGSGYLAQRCMACRSPREARVAPVIFAFTQVRLRSLLWLPLMIALLAIYPLAEGQSVAERELAFVRGIDSLLPAGARGLMLVGLLAALASTLDTHLNWGASYLANDLYARGLCRGLLQRKPRARQLVWVARLSTPLLVGASLVAMSTLGSIQAAWHATLLLGAGLGGPLLMRWLWRRANAAGEIAALAASAVAAPCALLLSDDEALRLLAVAAIGTAASVVASLLTPSEPPALLDAFYRRVRPPASGASPQRAGCC